MRAVNRLGLRVAGLTALVLVLLFGGYWGVKLLRRDGTPSEEEKTLTEAERTQDSDGDGVADLYETTYYGTNPGSRDTDGDGTSDLDEILAGRDPNTADQDGLKPPTGEAVTEQNTYTQKYLASLPTDIPREEILDEPRLSAFVEANKEPILPAIDTVRVQTTTAVGKEAVSAYLDAVSSSHNPAIKPVTSTDLEVAFREQATARNTAPMQQIIASLTGNIAELEKAQSPAETQGLHQRLLAATQGLLDNARLLSAVDADFVGGLIAAKRIEELGAVFQQIAGEVQALETKYGLE